MFEKLESFERNMTDISSSNSEFRQELQSVVAELKAVKKENKCLTDEIMLNRKLIDKLENQSRKRT